MYKIANLIGGDQVAIDVTDKVQEVRIAALEAVSGYAAKTGESFDDFVETDAFNKYIKTCLWNKRAKYGSRISQRFPVTNVTQLSEFTNKTEDGEDSGDGASLFMDLSSVNVSSLFDDVSFAPDAEAIVNYIITDPKAIKPNGRLNKKKLARDLSMSKRQADAAIEKLKHILKDYEIDEGK